MAQRREKGNGAFAFLGFAELLFNFEEVTGCRPASYKSELPE